MHLLLNESISSRDVSLLDVLSDRFPRILFKRHLIPEELFRERDFSDSLWSKAACYRLLLPELLFDIDVCLYLDSDTLIVGDLTSLFQIDLTDTYLAGVFEDIAPVREQTVGREIPGTDTYINSGVLLMNLRKMRSDRIRDQLYAGISRYLVVDQDLLNVCCYGHIRLLPQEYNCIPGVYVKEPRIYHFLMRDYLRPWKNRRAAGADLWWKYAEHFREAIDLDALRAEADWFQRGSITWLFRRCADYEKVYVVGSGLDAQRIFRALRLGKCHFLKGIVREEDALAYGADILVIAATRRKKIPALKPFLEQKDADRQVICYERRPVSFYNLLPPECSKEVYGELVQWEYGVDGRQVLVPSALLEINAARCPDAEASVRYKNGVRMSTTFREENRQANRIADLLVKAGRRRERVLAGDAAAPEPFAVFSGILKAGCVAVFPGRRDGDAVRIRGVSSRSFQISFSSNMISDLTELAVPTQDVLFLCHEMETSPAALFALLIAEFLRKAGPKDGKEHIVAQIPIDYRRVLGLPHTMKNAAFSFLADLEDPQWEGMDFSQKAGLLRKKIKEAEDARIARGWIQFYRDYGIAWSMADGHLPVSKDRGGAYTFMLTYLRTSCPECWEGRELIFTGFSAFQDFCMVEYGGKFHIWLRPMKYVDEAGTLRHVFASHGLPVEVSQRKGPSFLAKIPHKRLKT